MHRSQLLERFQIKFILIILALGPSAAVEADQAHVQRAEAFALGQNSYRLRVTVRHTDEGWKHYADRWEVVSLQGKVLATRVLHHPHDNEQPFTRELSPVQIPQGERWVVIRAHDKVHDYSGAEIKLDLSQAQRAK